MKKIYLLLTVFLFASVSGQESGEESFDINRKLKDIDEDELIFQLNKIDEDDLSPLFPTEKKSLLDQDDLVEFNSLTNIIIEEVQPEPKIIEEVQPKPKTPPSQPIQKVEKPQPTQKPQNKIIKTPIPDSGTDNSSTTPTSTPDTKPASPQLTQAQIQRLEFVKKELYQKGQFYTLSRMKFENDEHEVLYYQALAIYNIVQNGKEFQKKNLTQVKQIEKSTLIQRAKDNLFNVGIHTTDRSLKERVVFWFGILSITHPKNVRDEKELTDTFLYIEKNMRGSNVYNDALLYLALIYKKIGNLDKAKEYYRKSLKTSPEDLVYNYKTDTMVPAEKLWGLLKDLR